MRHLTFVTKRNQKFIVLFGVLIIFFGILVVIRSPEVFAAETGATSAPEHLFLPDELKQNISVGGSSDNKIISDTTPSEDKSLFKERAENLEQRIKNIETEGKNLKMRSFVITILLIMSFLFNLYLFFKVRHIFS